MKGEMVLEGIRSAPTGVRVQLVNCAFARLRRWNLDDLAAPYWRLYWNDRPGARVLGSDGAHALLPSRLLLIPPDAPFRSRCRTRVGHLHLHFTVEPRRRPKDRTIRAFPLAGDPVLAGLIREVVRALHAPESDATRAVFLGEALAGATLGRLPAGAWRERFDDPRVEAAAERIARAHPDAVPGALLAREAGMHPNAFLRLFRQVAGETPGRYRRGLRLEEACLLLHHSRITVDAIAEKTGFCDRFHFSRIFKQVTGLTPVQFRRRALTDGRI